MQTTENTWLALGLGLRRAETVHTYFLHRDISQASLDIRQGRQTDRRPLARLLTKCRCSDCSQLLAQVRVCDEQDWQAVVDHFQPPALPGVTAGANIQPLERAIILALLADMRAQGYVPAAVWDGEEYVMADRNVTVETQMFSWQPTTPETDAGMRQPMSDEQVLEAVGSVDISTLHFTHQHKLTWGDRGVELIRGNGEDVIADSHSPRGKEPFNGIISALYDRITDGQLEAST